MANAKRLFAKGWDSAARREEAVQKAEEKKRAEAEQEKARYEGEAAKHERDARGAERKLQGVLPWVRPLSALQLECSLDHALLVPYAEMGALGRTRRTSFSEELRIEMA